MCCTRLAENTGRKNYAKVAICAPSHKGMYRQSEKLVKHQYLLHMSSQYGELRPTNGWNLLVGFGHLSKFKRVLRLGFGTAPTSLNGGQPNFERCLAVFCAGALCIHFWRNFARCKIHYASKSCVLLYSQRYCTALEQWASAKLCGVDLHATVRPSRSTLGGRTA